MRPVRKAGFLVAIYIAMVASARADQVVLPKASLIDIPTRRAELKANDSPRVAEALQHLDSCLASAPVPAPSGRMIIPPHYFSGGHGPINPEEAKVTRIYNDFERRVAAGMNQFVANGSHAEANCAQQQLDTWAQAATLLDYDPKESSQAWFQVEWTLSSIGISESVLVNDPALDQATVKRDIAWMNKVAHRTVNFDQASKQRNNHHYWRGLAATAVGVVSGDDALFTFGLNTFREAVNEIDSNGAFPQEMARHERAIHYQDFALQPLIPIAEFAERQHVDLYAYTSPTHKTIADAVAFLGRAVADPALVKQYASEDQIVDSDARDFYSFAEFYLHRFGVDGVTEQLAAGITKPSYASRIGGNTTVLAGPTTALGKVLARTSNNSNRLRKSGDRSSTSTPHLLPQTTSHVSLPLTNCLAG